MASSVGEWSAAGVVSPDLRFVAGDGRGTVLAASDRPDAPDVAGELLTGEAFDMDSSWPGQVVVLNFWGSWCGPCRAEAKELMAVYTATRDSGVRFLGVDVKDDRQLAVAFEEKFGVTYPSLFDPKGRIAMRLRNYPPNAIPSTVVIDRSGRIGAAFLRPLLEEDLLPVVRTLADETPPAP